MITLDKMHGKFPSIKMFFWLAFDEVESSSKLCDRAPLGSSTDCTSVQACWGGGVICKWIAGCLSSNWNLFIVNDWEEAVWGASYADFSSSDYQFQFSIHVVWRGQKATPEVCHSNSCATEAHKHRGGVRADTGDLWTNGQACSWSTWKCETWHKLPRCARVCTSWMIVCWQTISVHLHDSNLITVLWNYMERTKTELFKLQSLGLIPQSGIKPFSLGATQVKDVRRRHHVQTWCYSLCMGDFRLNQFHVWPCTIKSKHSMVRPACPLHPAPRGAAAAAALTSCLRAAGLGRMTNAMSVEFSPLSR